MVTGQVQIVIGYLANLNTQISGGQAFLEKTMEADARPQVSTLRMIVMKFAALVKQCSNQLCIFRKRSPCKKPIFSPSTYEPPWLLLSITAGSAINARIATSATSRISPLYNTT